MISVRLDLTKRVAVEHASVAAEKAIHVAAELSEYVNPHSHPEMCVDPLDLIIT